MIVNHGSYTRTDARTMDYVDAALTRATVPQPLAANAAASAQTLASALEILSANPAPSIGEQFWRAMDAMGGPAVTDDPDATRGATDVAVPPRNSVNPASWLGRVASGEGATD